MSYMHRQPTTPSFMNKIVTLELLLANIKALQLRLLANDNTIDNGDTNHNHHNNESIANGAVKGVVFTNGCFDILHRGHVTYLAQAKALGNLLIVALNSDESVKRLAKGENRPINCLADRMAVIASIGDVDYVTSFTDDTPLELIKQINPQILVKGGDWAPEKIVGAKEVISRGGEVYAIPVVHHTSTTAIVNSIIKRSLQ